MPAIEACRPRSAQADGTLGKPCSRAPFVGCQQALLAHSIRGQRSAVERDRVVQQEQQCVATTEWVTRLQLYSLGTVVDHVSYALVKSDA